MTISFKVNGKKESVEADSDTPLLWVLRDFLDLTGTKFGCGKGVCGACTVHLDGAAIRSCQVPLSAIEGKNVSTIESLGESAPKLLESWVENNVPQCGYCQAGQLMSAAALLSVNAAPKDEEIDQAMSGNYVVAVATQESKKDQGGSNSMKNETIENASAQLSKNIRDLFSGIAADYGYEHSHGRMPSIRRIFGCCNNGISR